MPVIRTPEERFRDLPGFPFQPHYVEVNGMRVSQSPPTDAPLFKDGEEAGVPS